MNAPPDSAPPTETEIHAWVDDRLDEADRVRVDAWLARHPERHREVQAWRQDARQLRAAMGGMPASDRPMPDPAAIRARLRQRRRARLSIAAMLVVALGAGGVGGWQARDMGMPATPLVATAPMADAMQAHRMFAMERQARLDVTRQEVGNLQEWVDLHFRGPVQLPDLQYAGFHAVGGRLIPTESGAAAMVVYVDEQGSTLSFYLRPPAAGGALPRGGRREGQLAAAYWSGGGYNYALVGRAEGAGLRVIRDASGRSAI